MRTKPENLSAIVLAAGLSTRMGRSKVLLPFGRSTVVETVIENLRGSGINDIIAVLSREAASALPGLGESVRTAVNEAPERGQSSSLAIGLSMLGDGSDFCIMLADLPLVRADDIRVLTDAFAALPQDKSVLAPCRGDAFGHPMYYRALWRERLRGASGDKGGKKLLMQYDGEIKRVSAPDVHFKDIDTPEDYSELIKKTQS